MTNKAKKETEKEPTKREKLEDFLINWTKEKHLPLAYENKKLQNELKRQQELFDHKKIELDYQETRYEQCDNERLRYREMAVEYRNENKRLRQELFLLRKELKNDK
ncbi:hypothetical protein DWV15_14190 [Coprobacillus sp. AF02-13]|nr:hypothetical protein DWV15_14190 [Coprobacillus sp. AF02-13]